VGWAEQVAHPWLKVPSIILPESTNYLLNLMHPKASEITIADVTHFPFDEHLKAWRNSGFS